MRKVVPLMAMLTGPLLSLAGCGAPMRWEKPGTDAETLAKDQAYCTGAGRQEADRMYPGYLPPPFYPGHHGTAYSLWQQQNDSNRFFAGNSLARFCMRNKGYELVPIPKDKGAEK